MNMNTRDTVMKKLLDAQENVRDYEMFAKQVDDNEVKKTFKRFAEESSIQAKRLQELINKIDNQ